MITEDYVSFETAKLLKEKGFDECPLFRYDDCGQFWVQGGYDKTKNWHFPAPTLQMAMKWLRDVHKIFLNINFIPEHFCFTYRIVHNGVEEKFVVYPSTYEEACESAIKYCLEKLI